MLSAIQGADISRDRLDMITACLLHGSRVSREKREHFCRVVSLCSQSNFGGRKSKTLISESARSLLEQKMDEDIFLH